MQPLLDPAKSAGIAADADRTIANAFKRRVFLMLCAAAGACWLSAYISGMREHSFWLEAGLLALAMAATIEELADDLPLEKSLMAMGLVALLCLAAQFVAIRTGVPLSLIQGSSGQGNVTGWWQSLLSAVILLESRGAARYILRAWPNRPAPGFWTLGLACGLAAMATVTFSPPEIGMWLVCSLPTSAAILAFATPWLINKRPGSRNIAKPDSLIFWMALNLFFLAVRAT